MKFRYILVPLLCAVWFLPADVLADGWSLNPFASSKEKSERRSSTVSRPYSPDHRRAYDEPSIWEQFQRDMRRFNARTKRFLDDTADALTTPPPPPRVPNWLKPKPLFGPRKTTADRRYHHRKADDNRSWFDGLFAPDEPPMPQSPEDFVGMDRPEM